MANLGMKIKGGGKMGDYSHHVSTSPTTGSPNNDIESLRKASDELINMTDQSHLGADAPGMMKDNFKNKVPGND